MKQSLLQIDFTLTERWCRVSENGIDDPMFEMPALHWLIPAKAKAALQIGGEMSQAIGMRLPASFAGLSVLDMMLAKLLVLAQDDRWLPLPLEHLTFQMKQQYGYMQASYRIVSIQTDPLPTDDDARRDWLEARWRDDIAHQIVPVIGTISQQAGTKPELIWHQAGGRLAGIRELLRQHWEKDNPQLLMRFDWHAKVLTERLLPADFGCRRHPFVWTPRYTDNPWQQGNPMMLRSSCCMFDCRTDGQKCYTCPRMTKMERDIRRMEVLTEASN